MTYAARPSEFVPCFGDTPATRRAAAGRVAATRASLLRRIFDAIFDSRLQHAEREVVRYLERTGGRLTDDIERRITDRFVTGGWRD
jgi:hypothetical protein